MLRDLTLGARVVFAAPFVALTWLLEALAEAAHRVARAILRGNLR